MATLDPAYAEDPAYADDSGTAVSSGATGRETHAGGISAAPRVGSGVAPVELEAAVGSNWDPAPYSVESGVG